jgi:hypothetical protein
MGICRSDSPDGRFGLIYLPAFNNLRNQRKTAGTTAAKTCPFPSRQDPKVLDLPVSSVHLADGETEDWGIFPLGKASKSFSAR